MIFRATADIARILFLLGPEPPGGRRDVAVEWPILWPIAEQITVVSPSTVTIEPEIMAAVGHNL